MAHNNVLYSPYGAYELKSKYQRNLFLGTVSVTGFVGLILLTFWLINFIQNDDLVAIDASAIVIKTVADLGPPPSIAKKPPQVKVNQPNVKAPKVGIPKPVADDEVLDDDVVLATREELAEIVAPSVFDDNDDGDITVDIDEDDYMPNPDEFVPVEVYPEMIHQTTPEYPRLAKQAGITGNVMVKVLVDKEGNVRKALVLVSSGTVSLDESAVKAAYNNKFKPGIQNGRPVNVWVSYKVSFSLNE